MLEQFKLPNVYEVAKIKALTDEISELRFQTIRPLTFVVSLLLQSFIYRYFLRNSTILIGAAKYVLTYIFKYFASEQAYQAMLKAMVADNGLESLIRIKQAEAEGLSLGVALKILVVIFSVLQLMLLLINYYVIKTVAKNSFTYFDFESISDKAQEAEKYIRQLKKTSRELHQQNYSACRKLGWFFLIWIVPIFFDIADGLPMAIMGCLWIYFLYTAIESLWVNKAYSRNEKQITAFESQINQGVNDQLSLECWSSDVGYYLSTSYFTFAPIDRDSIQCKVKDRKENVPKRLVLKALKETLSAYGCKILAFDSQKGIIIARDKLFSQQQLLVIVKKLRGFIQEKQLQSDKLEQLQAQLNKVCENLVSHYYFWHYFPRENCLGLNVDDFSDLQRRSMIKILCTELGESRVVYSQESHYIKVSGFEPIQKQDFERLLQRLKSDNSVSSLTVRSDSMTSMSSKHGLKPKSKSISKKPNHGVNKSDASYFAISAPNLPQGSHFGKMTISVGEFQKYFGQKTNLHTHFLEALKTGRMGVGTGKRIVRLKKPKMVNGFNHSIFATHKLILPREDVRVYGELIKQEDQNIIDFNTIVPKHKWSKR